MAIPAKLSGKSIKSVTFSGGAGPVTLFTVTGSVMVNLVCVCMVSVTTPGAETVEVGIAGATAVLIAQVLGANIIAGEIWHDATPDAEIELSSVVRESIISDGNNIVLTQSGNVSTGTLDFYCNWAPLSADGLVVPA